MDEECNTLEIQIISGKGFSTGSFRQTCSTYVKLTSNNRVEKTSVQSKTLTPAWHEVKKKIFNSKYVK